MNRFSESKATIIGMGFLMEYIFPCFRSRMGDKFTSRVNAVTADAESLAAKRERLGIDIRLDDNAGALRAMAPDIIFFAPPPSVAPGLARDALAPYFAERRAAGRPLPLLLAFPPSPAGAYYLETMGDDIKVVNIIPNMISAVGDLPVSGEACNLFTFPTRDNWISDEKEALFDFFAPMGHALSVPPELILHALATEMSAHPVTELANIAARAFAAAGVPCTYPDAASALRAHHELRTGYTPGAALPRAASDIADTAARERLFAVWDAWYDAASAYLVAQGFPVSDTNRLLEPRYALFCMEAQVETRANILAHAKKDATKGGMLELFMQNYTDVLEPRLYALLHSAAPDDFATAEIGRLTRFIIAAVAERGKGLSRESAIVFTPAHQAIMFGLLAREILDVFGQERGDALLFKAVERYGNERGARMAKRAARNGDPLDMVSYFAYAEWSYADGFSKSVVQQEPYYIHRVHTCPWCDGWKDSGLAAYGAYYCRNVDPALVRGFNPALTLEMKSWLSDPAADCCEFHWRDARVSHENTRRQRAIAERIGESCRKDFIYHTAHLYSTVTKLAIAEDIVLGRRVMVRTHEWFARATSNQELLLVLAQEHTDFTAI